MRELTVRYRLRRLRVAGETPHPCVSKPKDAAAVLLPLLRHEVVEVVIVLCLSVRLELLSYHVLSRGTLDGAIVHPRDVFRTAILGNASSIVLGHNHPSGPPAPSATDTELTRRLMQASLLMDVTLWDHIIISPTGQWFSFTEAGLL
jgi:DNA repair protein RadC